MMKRIELLSRLSSEPCVLSAELALVCADLCNQRHALDVRISNIQSVITLATTIDARHRAISRDIKEVGEALADNDLLSLPRRLHDASVPTDDNPYRRD